MSKRKRKNRTAGLKHERTFYAYGCRYIFGFDEAGRGPWAGPVAVGTVCLPMDRRDITAVLRGVRDSKQMTVNQRESLVQTIKDVALAWGVGAASAAEITEMGINAATSLAMTRALSAALEPVDFEPDCLFLDYLVWPEKQGIPQVSIVGGDKYSLSIAAASILAKVWRDHYMDEVAEEFPAYGFERHKGYGTPEHRAALAEYGATPVHRLSYAPVAALSE